jgi:hypothetical protein
MSVTGDILMTYRAPGRGLARRLGAGRREDRALAVLMLGCAALFLSQVPVIRRATALDPSQPLEARLGAALLVWMFIAPLFFYLLAGISRLLARLLGGTGTGYAARLALFWALLAAAPLFLLNGLVLGLTGPGAVQMLVGYATLALFLWMWIGGLVAAERGRAT